MSWIMQTCGSGSGGGGAVTITDGVDPTIVATVLDLTDSNPLTVAIVDAAGDQITSFGSGAIRRVATATVNGFIADTDIDITNCESVVINVNTANLDATLIARFSVDGVTFTTKDLLDITQNLSMARVSNMLFTGGAINRSFLFVVPPGVVTARVAVSAYASGTGDMTILASSEFHQTFAAIVRRDSGDVATGVPMLGFNTSGVVKIPSVEAHTTYDRFTPGFVTHIGSGNNAAAPVTVRLSDGTNAADVKAASTAAVATDKAQVVAISPNNSVAVTNANLDVALSTRLAEATFTGRINTQGQKAMAASTPVVIASDQSGLPVDISSGSVGQAPTDISQADAWWQRITDGTNGPVKVLGASEPVDVSDPALVVALSQNGAALVVDQGETGSGTSPWATYISDGTNYPAAVKPASTAAVAADKALVVAVSPNNTVPVTVAALGVAQGADATSVTGPMVQALVSDARESYLSNTIRPLSLTSDGRLRVSTSPADSYINFFGEFGLNGDADNFGICDSPWANEQMSVWP